MKIGQADRLPLLVSGLADETIKELNLLREYEITIIGSAQLSDDASKKSFKKYEDILCAEGGEVLRRDEWGTKRMAFPINKQFRGRYMNYDLTGTPAQLAEAERLMRIDENILRYMSVRIGESIDVEARKAEIAREQIEAEKAREAEQEKARFSTKGRS